MWPALLFLGCEEPKYDPISIRDLKKVCKKDAGEVAAILEKADKNNDHFLSYSEYAMVGAAERFLLSNSLRDEATLLQNQLDRFAARFHDEDIRGSYSALGMGGA